MNVTAARIPDKWVNPLRGATALVVLTLLALFTGGIAPRYAELIQACDPALCEPLEPREADIAALEQMGLSPPFYAIFHIGIEVALVLVSLLLIVVLFWRASHLWVGIAAILGVSGIATTVANVIYALGEVAPWTFPLFAAAELASVGGMTALFYIFPDGRFTPKWTVIPCGVLTTISYTVQLLGGLDYVETPLTDNPFLLPIAATALVLALLFGFITQLIRYRRYYDHLQRQQTRWLMASIIGMILGLATWGIVFESTLIPYGPARVLSSFIGMTFLMLFSVGLIPYAVTIAILRYRLWNIDLIIRRTLIYGAITALLAGLYFGGVTLSQRIFSMVAGEGTSLGVVISTLAIAALFTPLRNRVQTFVDRRFFRQQYNAQATLEAFSESVRDEVDLDELQKELVSTVQTTVQPEHVALWLAESG